MVDMSRPSFDADAVRAVISRCVNPPASRPQDAGLRAVFAVMHSAAFDKPEDAWTHYHSSRQRYYEWKPSVEIAMQQLALVEAAVEEADWESVLELPESPSNPANTLVGDVEVRGNLNVRGTSTAHTFERSAEQGDWAERFPTHEALGVGQVVGLKADGFVSLTTDNAVRIGIVSESPSFLGNVSSAPLSAAVTFPGWPGQVEVMVIGPVAPADALIASGRNDGLAVVRHSGGGARVLGNVIGEVDNSDAILPRAVHILLGGDAPVSLASLSTTSSRNENLIYFEQDLGLSPSMARIMYQAQRLQDKGQMIQAIICYDRVLKQRPDCTVAKKTSRCCKLPSKFPPIR